MALDHPWTEPPRPGAAIDVLPGIKWLRMPLPFRLDHINLWLLDDGPGWTVVDTGIGLEETRALWERVFAETLDGRPLTRVVVTHFHPDHMGNAGWLTERWRAGLWCTQAEWLYAQWAWLSRDAATIQRRLAHYRRHGRPAAARPAVPWSSRPPGPAPGPPRGEARRGGGCARRAAERRPARPHPVPPRARSPPARLRARRGARPPALPRGRRPRRAPGRRRRRPPLPQGVTGPRQLRSSTRPTG